MCVSMQIIYRFYTILKRRYTAQKLHQETFFAQEKNE